MKSRRSQRGFWNFVLPAVATVAGALLNKKSASDAAETQAQVSRDISSEALAYQKEADAANREVQERVNAENRRAVEEANAANLAAQKEFAQHGVSWKIADAKAAGLHPLFGAGLTGSTFSPTFQASQGQAYTGHQAPRQYAPPVEQPTDYSWLASLGQLMGNWLGSQQAGQAQQQQAAKESDQQAIITEHPGGGRTIVYPIKGLESQVQGRPLDAPMATMGVADVFSSRARALTSSSKSYVTSPDDKPFWERFSFGSGFSVLLPKTSEPQEVFEDKPLWFWAMVAKANVKEYGPGWLSQARQQFPSLREVYDGVVQELRAVGLWPFK